MRLVRYAFHGLGVLGLGVLGLGVLAVGCGDGDGKGGGGGSGGTTLPDGALFPLKVGNSWTFRVTSADAVSMKTQAVMAEEMVMGSGPNAATMAFRLVTMKGDGTDKTESWQALVGDRVVRYREVSYGATSMQPNLEEHWDPPRLRVDQSAEHKKPQASWLEMYKETKMNPPGSAPVTTDQRDQWQVVRIEPVTVPAKTFDAALVVQKVSATSGNLKMYWFVPGVGKVKESGEKGSETEELASYQVSQ